MKLLTVKNTKTAKGMIKGFMTAILHLAPHTVSGRNVCPWASKGCSESCLNTAGRGRFDGTQQARINRTKYYFEQPEAFRNQLIKEIEAFRMATLRKGFIPTVRLNGTSDIPKLAIEMAKEFPYLMFYDYTKSIDYLLRDDLPKNLHLTFSRSETNDRECLIALANGHNVAVVFEELPETWNGYKVVNGDETDLRFLDSDGVVIGLTAKGQAKGDTTGFVVRGEKPLFPSLLSLSDRDLSPLFSVA